MAVPGCLINLLKLTGYYTYHQVNIKKVYILPTERIYVLCDSYNNNSNKSYYFSP
jgi:hypothetical protein